LLSNMMKWGNHLAQISMLNLCCNEEHNCPFM
jgi:hypothetical protein